MSATLTAGRELDALVAEQVMGWTQFPYVMSGGHDSGIVRQWGVSAITVHHCPPGRVHVSTIERVPAYSTDIAAAWQVVEKLRAERKRGNAMRQVLSLAHCYTAQQVATAICRAALSEGT